MSPTNHAPARLTRVFPSTARVKPRQDAPRAMTRSHYLTMAFHESLDVAQNLALRDMLRWMRRVTGLRAVDLYRTRFGSVLSGLLFFFDSVCSPNPTPRNNPTAVPSFPRSSLVGDMSVTQVVNGKKGVHLAFPRRCVFFSFFLSLRPRVPFDVVRPARDVQLTDRRTSMDPTSFQDDGRDRARGGDG